MPGPVGGTGFGLEITILPIFITAALSHRRQRTQLDAISFNQSEYRFIFDLILPQPLDILAIREASNAVYSQRAHLFFLPQTRGGENMPGRRVERSAIACRDIHP